MLAQNSESGSGCEHLNASEHRSTQPSSLWGPTEECWTFKSDGVGLSGGAGRSSLSLAAGHLAPLEESSQKLQLKF